MSSGGLHHVELWVPDLVRVERSWGRLLSTLGWRPFQAWGSGRSWKLAGTYLVVEQSTDLTATEHDRRAPGLNHLAFHVAGLDDVDAIVADAPDHGWSLLFGDRHPYAGGAHQYAAYLSDFDGFEAEIVASGGMDLRAVVLGLSLAELGIVL